MSDVEIWSPDPEAVVAAAPTEWTPDPSWFHEVPEWLDATWEDGVVQLGPGDEVTRVAALVAPYGECILDGGRNGQACFTPPISPTNYEYAHVGALRTADGSIARVANIGGGVPHYDPNKPLDMSPAVHHYANTTSRVMVGRYYDRPDLGGIIFLGATWPGVDPQVARSAPLSGDWRWVDSMQDWDFAGAQQVLNPGFRPNRHNRRRASTVGRHSLLAPALSNMEFAMVASLGPSGDEHMLGAWVPSDDGNVLAPATLIDLAELSAIVASLEDELAVLIEDSTPLLPFYDQPTEAIVASARKRRKKRSDAWLATHPNPKSTPRDIVGKHGHRPHGPSILSPRIYEHLRAKGYSKAKAAAISNAMFNKRRGKPPKSVKGTKGLVGVGKVASLGTPVDLGDATIDGEPMTKGNIILVPDNPDALTVPGGDPADVLHATLKFLGDLDPWDDEQRERAEGIVGEWARTHGPFTANVAGVGELGDDGAVVYHFDGDDLQAARADLSAAIDDGTAPDTTDTYPSFKPHVTAGYGIDAPPVPTEPITFSRARVQWADEALEWPLGQPVEAPVAAARPRKRLRQAESLFDGPNAGRVGGGRHDYHDPNTGEFAPLGYVSPQVLRKLLSDNPTLRREAELAIRTKFDSPKAQPWVRAFQGATPAKRGKIARNARREIIGDRPDGTTADDRKAQVAWDRASDVVARGLSRGTGGEDRMVDVPDALDDGHPRPVGITPSGAQVFRDEDFTRLRPHELRPGDLIGNAERDDGLETVEVTAVRTDGGRTLVDVGTSEVPYARDDIVKVLRRPDELTAAEARKPKPVNPDQGGLFDDPVPAPVEPEPELSGPEADAAAMGAMGRMVFERVAQGEVLRKADEAFDKDSLDKLVDLGVIEPAPRPDKRKAQQYVLTAKGTAALPIIQQATRDRDRRRREKWEAKNGITPPPAPVVPVAPRPEPEPPQVVNATPYHVEAIRRWAEGTIDGNASGARFEATSRIADVNGDKVRVDVNVRRRDGDSAGARFSLVIDTTDRSLSSGGNVSGGEQLDREAASAIKRSALKDDFVIRKVVLDDTDPRFPGVRDGWTPNEAPGEPDSIPPMSNTTDEQAAALDAAVLDVLGTSGTWFDHAQLLNRTPQGTGMDDVRKSIARLDEQGLLEYKGGFGGQVRRKPEPEVPGPPRTATQQRLDALFERAASGPSNYGPSGEPWARAIGIVNDHHVQVNIFGWGNDERRTVWVDKSDEDLTPEMAASLIGGPEAPTVDPDADPADIPAADLPDDDEIAKIEAELGFDAGPDDVVATESRGARPGAGQGGLFDAPDLFGDEPDTAPGEPETPTTPDGGLPEPDGEAVLAGGERVPGWRADRLQVGDRITFEVDDEWGTGVHEVTKVTPGDHAVEVWTVAFDDDEMPLPRNIPNGQLLSIKRRPEGGWPSADVPEPEMPTATAPDAVTVDDKSVKAFADLAPFATPWTVDGQPVLARRGPAPSPTDKPPILFHTEDGTIVGRLNFPSNEPRFNVPERVDGKVKWRKADDATSLFDARDWEPSPHDPETRSVRYGSYKNPGNYDAVKVGQVQVGDEIMDPSSQQYRKVLSVRETVDGGIEVAVAKNDGTPTARPLSYPSRSSGAPIRRDDIPLQNWSQEAVDAKAADADRTRAEAEAYDAKVKELAATHELPEQLVDEWRAYDFTVGTGSYGGVDTREVADLVYGGTGTSEMRKAYSTLKGLEDAGLVVPQDVNGDWESGGQTASGKATLIWTPPTLDEYQGWTMERRFAEYLSGRDLGPTIDEGDDGKGWEPGAITPPDGPDGGGGPGAPDTPDAPGDATPEPDGGLESLSDADLATVKAAAIEWVNVTPEPDAMRQLADVLDEEARRAELAGDTDRAAKLRANAAKWRKNAGDADEPDPEPEVDPEVERRAGYETIVADTTTIIDANRTAAEREGADPFAVNFLADTLDRRANAYDELDRTDDAAADRAHAGRLRGALAERQAREEAARNVPTLEAILGSSTFDSGRTLELGRLVNGNPDAVLGDTASRVSLGAITTAIRTLDGDLDPVEPGDRFSADSTTAAVGLALLRGARVSTIPNGIAIELSDGQAGTGGSGRYLLIRDSAGGQKLEAYDADGRRTFSGERLPFAHFTGILQPRPTGNMPDGARNAIDSARADVANPDVNTLDVLAGHRDAFVASLSTVAPPEEWHQHPGIVAAVTEFGDVLRDAVAETEAGIDLDMSAGLAEDVAATSKSFDLADTLVEFADRLASDGGGFDPQDLDGHATIAEFLKATDGEFVSFADSGKLSDGSTRQSIRFAYTHESGERRTMDVDLMGNDWNPDDPTMSVSIYRRGGGGYRSRDVRLRGDDVRKADLKQLRSHVRATRALNRDRKRSAALGKADEVNASGTTQRRNAQAAAAVLASLGVERGLDDDTADTIKVNSGTGVITRRKTVNREGLATALGRSRTVKATPAKKRGAASDADLLTVGMAQYPTSWIESLGDHTFLIARRGDANSGYNVDMSRWTSAGAPNGSYLSIPGKGDVGANVIVHEVGHTMEHKVPGLREFVLAHLDTLHAGSDPAKALPGYRSTRGYEDDIKRVYTRRVYVGNGGDPHGTWASVRSKITSTEYLTTGMETLVPEGGSNEDDFYGIDPVHDAFILGVVATFDPNAVPAAGTVVAP